MTATCRIFLVGEGVCDIGDLALEPSYRGSGKEGFLRPVLSRMMTPHFVPEFDGQKITHLPKVPQKMGKAFLRTKVAQAMILASASGARFLVFARDLDKTLGTAASATERRRRFKVLMEDIGDDIARTCKHDPELAHLKVFVLIATRMIEAWALGDRAAIIAYTGNDKIALPHGSPEDYWGDEDDESGNHPKQVFKRVVGVSANANVLGQLAKLIDPKQLAASCADSFGPAFAEMTQQIAVCQSAGD